MSPEALALIGAGVNSAGSVGSTVLQNYFQKKAQQREFDYNTQMWNQANYYNSPEQQMARLEKAGLNPNLVYGNGSAAGNSSTQTPRYQAPALQRLPLETLNPLMVLGQYQDLRQKTAQANLTEAQVKYADLMNLGKISVLNETARNYTNKNLMAEWSMVDPKSLPDYTKNSMYFQGLKTNLAKYSAETDSTNMRTAIMDFERQFLQSVPKQYQWLAPLLIRLFAR